MEDTGESKPKIPGAMEALGGNLELSCTPRLRTLVGHSISLLCLLLTTPLCRDQGTPSLGCLSIFPYPMSDLIPPSTSLSELQPNKRTTEPDPGGPQQPHIWVELP